MKPSHHGASRRRTDFASTGHPTQCCTGSDRQTAVVASADVLQFSHKDRSNEAQKDALGIADLQINFKVIFTSMMQLCRMLASKFEVRSERQKRRA
jgi:hypothetical protein